MKEDIILNAPVGDTAEFAYTLDLPDELEARIGDDGSLGIYSPSPALFGTTDTTQDREKILSARRTAPKTHLLFVLPAPVVIEKGGQKASVPARFVLDGDTLTVTAEQLQDLAYPLSIDPSVAITSSSDFQQGNAGDSIEWGDGEIVRKGIKGGVGAWSTTTSLPTASNAVAAVASNGYMYTIGGTATGATVNYAPINSDGTLDSWTSTSSLAIPRSYAGAAAYNGRIYVWGGYNTTTAAATASVEYADIHSDGTLGAWQPAASMTTAVCRAATTAYKGYLYALGGSTTPSSGCTSSSTGGTNTVQYAPILADGTIGTWQTTTNIAYGTSGQVIAAMAGAAGGYMYVLGGSNNNAGTAYANVQVAPINDDGTLGSWTATTSLAGANYSAGVTLYNGYLYVLSSQGNATTAYYAQVFADGTVGEWFMIVYAPLTLGRWGGAAVAYGDYVYYIGGNGPTNRVEVAPLRDDMKVEDNKAVSTSYTTSRERAVSVGYGSCLYLLGGYGGNGNNYVPFTQYAPVNDDGNITTAWPNNSFNGNGRADLAAVAYNGYLYSIGGYYGHANTYFNTVQYASIGADCSLGTWTNTNAFDTGGNARGGITAFAYNGYLYVAGGINASGNFNTVRYAPLNSNGTVGTWNSTTNLPAAMNRHRTVVWGNRVYLLGGTQLALPNPNNGATTGSRPTGAGSSNTYYATINDNGTLGSWTATTALPYDAYEFGATASNGYMVIVGGYTSTGSGVERFVYTAPIDTDGTLGSWTASYDRGVAYPIASLDVAVVNGHIYIMGGRRDSALTNAARDASTVRMVSIHRGNGATSTWTASHNLVVGRSHAGSTAYNGYAYVVGGSSNGGSTGRSDIEYSAIGRQTHSLGSFSTDAQALSSGRMFPGVAAYNGRLYVVGGRLASGYYGNVQHAAIGANGALGGGFVTEGSFTTGTGSDTGRAGACTVAYRGHLYAIGGYDGSNYYNTVRYSDIDSTTGALGAWADGGHSFSGARYGSSCFATSGYLYVLGGRNGATNYNDAWVAPINGNGSIGAWVRTASFDGARAHFVAGTSNGYVYIYGGCATSACTSGYGDVQYASIGRDGMLNSWQRRPETNTGYAPYLTTGFVYDSFVYQLGGSEASASSAATAQAGTRVTPQVGYYSKLVDLGQMANITSITASGLTENSYAPGASPVSFRSAGSSGLFRPSTLSTDITSSVSACDTDNVAYTRYVLVEARLDNMDSSAFAASTSQRATLSDITIHYNPSLPTPDTRLHGGKTLQSGTLSPLDTCQR